MSGSPPEALSPVISAGSGEEDGVLPIEAHFTEHSYKTLLGSGMLEFLVVGGGVRVRIELWNLEVPGHLVVAVGFRVVRLHSGHKVAVEVTYGRLALTIRLCERYEYLRVLSLIIPFCHTCLMAPSGAMRVELTVL